MPTPPSLQLAQRRSRSLTKVVGIVSVFGSCAVVVRKYSSAEGTEPPSHRLRQRHGAMRTAARELLLGQRGPSEILDAVSVLYKPRRLGELPRGYNFRFRCSARHRARGRVNPWRSILGCLREGWFFFFLQRKEGRLPPWFCLQRKLDQERKEEIEVWQAFVWFASFAKKRYEE